MSIPELKEWLTIHRRDLILGLLFFLVSSTSFALGYVVAHDNASAPIIIQKNDAASGATARATFSASVGEATGIIPTAQHKVILPLAPSAPPAETSTPVVNTPPAPALPPAPVVATAATRCRYQTSQFPNYSNLILNEIAWMGTSADSNNEWIELKNISSGPIDLENYQVIDKGEQIKVMLPKTTLPSGGFFLLERGEDAVPTITAGAVYTGALSNTNEGVRLFDKNCFLVDEVEAIPDWPAGDADAKRSMERNVNMSWHTYTGDAVAAIFGTPTRENSVAVALAAVAQSTPQPTPVADPAPVAPTPTEPAPVESVTPPPATETTTHILISKIQTTGGPGKTTEDFVELYNPGSATFNLNGYRLVKRTQNGTSDTLLKSWTTDTLILAGATYRWANTGYPGSADVRTSGSIADDNAVALRQGSADTGAVIDAVGWGVAANGLMEGSVFSTNPAVGQLLVRKNNQDTNNNAADFEIQ